MKKFLILIISLVVVILPMAATTPEEVPNVHLSDRTRYVSDPDGLLSPEAVRHIDSQIRAFSDSTTAEMAVVILNSAGDMEIEEFARELTDKWKIGKDDKDNGILLLLVMDQHAARIHTGYGMEGVLPDITARKIIDNTIIPEMKRGNIDAALVSATDAIIRVVEDPSAADEIRSAKGKGDAMESLDSEFFLGLLKIVAGMAFFAALILFIVNARKARKHITNYDKSLVWRKNLVQIFILAILSAGTGLIFAIIALIIYRRYRTRRIKCATCGAKMNRLGEAEDNELLTSGEDIEEQLNTVDYDVWLCPDCGTVEKFPYYVSQNQYKPCPRCRAIAYGLVRDRVIQRPTATAGGYGVRTYECKHCGYSDDTHYTMPKDESLATAAILGAAVAGMGRGGGGGGGFSGGSFGGGGFGGGGASGHW